MTEDPRRSHILSPTVSPIESQASQESQESRESRETFPITTESVQVSLAATTLFVLDGQENQEHVTQNMEPTSGVKEDHHQISAEVTGSPTSEHLEEVSPNHGEVPSQYGDISSIIEDLRSSTDGDDIEKLSSELKYTLGDEASRIEKLSLPLKSSDIDKKPQEPKTNSGYGDLGMDYSSFSLGSSNAKDGNIGRESKKHGEAFLSGEASLSSEVLSPRSETRPGGSEKDAWNLQTALPNNVHKHQPSASPTIAIAPQSSSRPPQSPPNSIEPASNLPPDAIDMNLPEGGTNISEIPSNTIEASADPLKEDQLNEAITLTEINEILRTLDAEEQQPSKHTPSESHPIEKTPSQRQPNDHWHYFHDRLMGELADASPTVSRIRKNTGSVSLPIVESSPDTQADILVEIPSESNSGELFPSAQNLVSLPGAESSESLPYRTIGKSALNGFHAKRCSTPQSTAQ
ncbi:hypothetical protein JCM33374_g3351 [Metschnikowia sp. JCM 33374]|nr:hypothetical protein JCM33374_g3351 [Metschnikowia sp. JCM 33374]